MRVVEVKVEPTGQHQVKLTALIDLRSEETEEIWALGEGPTGDAVPDKIVRALISEVPTHSLSLDEIQRQVGGNTGTVNRQAWTLATNAPDLQLRLRGWVVSPERGVYALSAAARSIIDAGRRFP